MRCPFCNDNDDKVIDSRSSDGGRVVRRRRQCMSCNKRFTTYEHIEVNSRLSVIKRDGTRVPYDRQKVLAGLEKACYKRPVRVEQLQQLVEAMEEQLFHANLREVESIDIGRTIGERLKHVDQVAYVRYASVYKAFKNIDDLLDEVREVIESSAPPEPPHQGRLF